MQTTCKGVQHFGQVVPIVERDELIDDQATKVVNVVVEHFVPVDHGLEHEIFHSFSAGCDKILLVVCK